MHSVEKEPLPFGLQFAESRHVTSRASSLALEYDEDSDCTVLLDDGRRIPFVKTAMSRVTTHTITEAPEDPENDPEEHDTDLAVTLLTLTETRQWGESPQPDEDPQDQGIVW